MIWWCGQAVYHGSRHAAIHRPPVSCRHDGQKRLHVSGRVALTNTLRVARGSNKRS